MNIILTYNKRSYAFIFLVFFVSLNAQNKVWKPYIPSSKNTDSLTVVDTVRIRILYAFNATNINDSETYDDLQRLDIGEHFSKYYSFFFFNSDSLVTEWKNKHSMAQTLPIRLGKH